MKTVLKLLPIFFVAFVFAQTPPPLPDDAPMPPPPKMSKEKMIEHLTRTLDLSEAQVNSIKEIDASFENEEAKIDGQLKALRNKKREIMERKKAEIDKILTVEQKAKMEEMKKKRVEKRKERKRESSSLKMQ